MPKSIPYTLFAPLSLAVRYTPARLELIAAVGPPDCPTISFHDEVPPFCMFARRLLLRTDIQLF